MEIHVTLTAHLFRRRTYNKEEEKHTRSFMFQSQLQYEDLLKYAIEHHELLSYYSVKHVILFFYALIPAKKYGMAMDIQKLDDDHYHITIITIEGLKDRHFVQGAMFLKEEYKIFSEYVLPKSYIRDIEEKIHTIKGVHVYSGYFFNSLFYQHKLHNKIDLAKLISSFSNKIENGELEHGTFWVKVPIGKGKSVFLRVVYELFISYGMRKHIIIFYDMKINKNNVMAFMENSGESMLSYDDSRDFGKSSYKRMIGRRNGLKIVRKSS